MTRNKECAGPVDGLISKSRTSPNTPLLFFMAVLFVLSWSAPLASANGLDLNGLGGKARSMGGAFIGLADDYSAIYWNPAGMALLNKNGFGISLNDSIPRGTYRQQLYISGQGSVPIIDSQTLQRPRFSGLAAGSYSLSNRWVVGLGVYTPTDFGISWNGAEMMPLSGNSPNIRWESRISVITIALASAYKLSDRLFVGASLCFNSGRFTFDRYAGNFLAPLPDPPYMQTIDLGQYEENLTGGRCSALLGILYRPNDWISLGASFRTPYTIKFEGEAKVGGFSSLSAALQREINSTSGIDKNVAWPMSLGGGIAVRPMNALTLTADLQWTRWSRLDIIQTNYKDPNWNIYMAERGNDKMPIFDRDSLQIRFGAEYQLKRLAVRAGFYTDPALGPDSGVNILFPRKGSFGWDIGAGYDCAGWRLDVGLEYLATRNTQNDLNLIPVYPPSSGTTWEYVLPGQFTAATLTPSFSVSHRF